VGGFGPQPLVLADRQMSVDRSRQPSSVKPSLAAFVGQVAMSRSRVICSCATALWRATWTGIGTQLPCGRKGWLGAHTPPSTGRFTLWAALHAGGLTPEGADPVRAGATEPKRSNQHGMAERRGGEETVLLARGHPLPEEHRAGLGIEAIHFRSPVRRDIEIALVR